MNNRDRKNKRYQRYIATGDISIVDAMRMIDDNQGQIIVVVDDDQCLRGCVSDGDIRRSIISDGRLDKPIEDIMNKSPKYIHGGGNVTKVDWDAYEEIHLLPVVDDEKRVIDVLKKKHSGEKKGRGQEVTLKDVPVVIMAGGEGTRLYPFTKILPKPLIPIGDIPIVERIVESYVKYGIDDFILSVNYKKNMIHSYFDELCPKYRVEYVEENKPLGTAGSLKLIKRKFSNPIFVTNCDILIEADYADIYRHHKETESAITIVSALKNICVPYGVIYSEEGGIISSMEEKPCLSYLINTGMYVINPDCIDDIPEDEVFHMPSLVDKLMKKGLKVSMYPISEDSFLDMGEFAEMGRMEEKLGIVKKDI